MDRDDLLERLEACAEDCWGELACEAAAEIRSLRVELERRKYDGIHTCHDQCQRVACVLRRENEALRAQVEQERAAKYSTFTDGMEAAAEICGSLAETTYDDTDSFDAATGCEAAIMSVVRQQRREQSAARRPDRGRGTP